MKITDQTEQSRAPKGLVKNKNAKAPSSSGVHASLTKRSKNGKDKQPSSAVSNVTLALDSRPRQSIKGRPFNDRQSEMAKVYSVITFACFHITHNCASFVPSFVIFNSVLRYKNCSLAFPDSFCNLFSTLQRLMEHLLKLQRM